MMPMKRRFQLAVHVQCINVCCGAD